MRSKIVAWVLACVAPLGVRADMTDLWFNPTESGWGVNIIQQADVLFATMFVYGTGSRPTWYVASAVFPAGQGYSGNLYETSGPVFSGPFDPSAVTLRQVGTFSIIPSTNSQAIATLTYTVDGTTVNKIIERQTWRASDLNGGYMGGSVGTYSGCPSNGYREEQGFWSITQTPEDFRMSSLTGMICDFSGAYRQTGRTGTSDGLFTCSGSTGTMTGTYLATNMEKTGQGFSANLSMQSSLCRWEGTIGGLRQR